MDKSGSRNQGCLIPVVIVLGLGAMLLFFDYVLIVAHLAPPFCTRPECQAMSTFLHISAASSVVALTCATLAALSAGPRWLPMLAVGALLVSIATGLLTGIGMWSLPNALITLVVTWLLLLLVADQ